MEPRIDYLKTMTMGGKRVYYLNSPGPKESRNEEFVNRSMVGPPEDFEKGKLLKI